MKNKKIEIINLTPHSVRVVSEEGKTIAEFPSQGVLRLSEHREKITEIQGIPVFYKEYGTTELPEKRQDTYYIVSLPVAQAFPDRDDFIVPDNLVRDNQGRVIGCKAFAKVSKGGQQ